MDRNPFVTAVKCDRSPQVMSHESGVVGVRDDRLKKGKKKVLGVVSETGAEAPQAPLAHP